MKENFMRVITPSLLALILLSNVACAGSRDQWQPIESVAGGLRRHLVGDPHQPGAFKYQLKIPAGARAAVHRHSTDVNVKVLSGSMFIIIGEPLEKSRAQRFAAGSVFVVPANAWHDEWWDEETILEAEGVGPMETVYKSQSELISRVDHIVYATPDLNRGIEEIEKLLGVRATAGGQHPGRGTRNALIALGPTTYLEIIAPDPEQPTPAEPRPFGIDGLTKSKLVAWFVKASDLKRLRTEAVRQGVPLGEVRSGSRRRPDGVQLVWQFTDPSARVGDGIVPLFIDWGDSPHPAGTSAKGATLISLYAEHPDVQSVRGMLQRLGVDLRVQQGQSPALIAVIEGPRGRVELR
ncbi:MAG TPA: VOC family protein [Pyrinomonadaceae bacterium]|nr:VOC family protein [Pyrinomonadaceae bacterium]